MTMIMKSGAVKYVVFGAAGKTGGAVIDELLRVGTVPSSIRAVVRRRDERCSGWAGKGVGVVEANLFDPAEVLESLRGAERAYFPPPFHPHMLQAFVAFLTAVQQVQLEQVVLLSQWIASPRHPSLATRQHWIAEELLRNSGIRCSTVINPGMFADNFLRLADFASLLGFYPHMTDASASAPVATADIARVVRVVLEDPDQHAGRRYRPTGPKLLTADEIAGEFSRALGRSVRAMRVPLWMFSRTARMQGIDAFEIGSYRFYMEDHRRGAFSFDGGVNAVVEELTGHPAEPFSTTLAGYLDRPFARRTARNFIRAWINFFRTPVSPGWNFRKMEACGRYPILNHFLYAADNRSWREIGSSTKS